MAPIELASFDIALVNFELVQSRASKTKTATIRATYGPDLRPLSFVTPACVVHWPKLHGDGDYGTRFGPSELTKAKYSACATDEDLPSGPNGPMRLWFAAVKAIDSKLAQFAHAQQTALFKQRSLSLEAVRPSSATLSRPRSTTAGRTGSRRWPRASSTLAALNASCASSTPHP
jgi:hypothetical protein